MYRPHTPSRLTNIVGNPFLENASLAVSNALH